MTDTPTPALTACLIACVEPISPTTRKAPRLELRTGERALERGPRARAPLAQEQRLRAQLVDGDLRASVPAMRGGNHHHDVVGGELAVLDPAVAEPRADHGELRPTLADPVDRGLAVADQQRDRDLGELLLEASDHGREDVLAGNRAGPDQELAAHPSEKPVHGLPRLLRQREQAHGVREEELSGRRDRGAASEAIQQPHAELELERSDVLGHGGLRERQRLGGARERPELRHLREDLELSQIHGGEYRRGLHACKEAGR